MLKAAFVIFAVLTAPFPSLAGKIDKLDTVLVDQDGKPLKNLAQRREGLLVVEEFDVSDRHYKPGDHILTFEEGRAAGLALDKAKTPNKMVLLDPDCSQCGPLTLRYALSHALDSGRVCADLGQGKRSPACTLDEAKAESDPAELLARHEEAIRIAKAETVTLGDKAIDLLKLLVAALYQNDPRLTTILAQVYRAIDPNYKPAEWGKE